MAIVISNGLIVSSRSIERKDIRLVGEKIDEIGMDLIREGDIVIDAKGNYVMPGGIDVHTHFECEANGLIADTFKSGTRAALKGGTTTIIDFAEQVRGGSLKDALEKWDSMTKDNMYTDYSYHMTICDWNKNTSDELESMIEKGITSFKMFFAYEDLMVSDRDIYMTLKRAKELKALVAFHCENGQLIESLREEALSLGSIEPIYHAKTRPASLEREAISRLLSIAELVDYPVYIVHLSSKEGFYEIERAKKNGSRVFVETCPHYLLLDESSYEGLESDPFNGGKYVMSPPLRDKKSKEVLWKGLDSGAIDVLATDHCAFNYKTQNSLGKDDFTKIPNGAPGVEDRFKLIYTYGVREKRIDIKRFVEVISENPAKIFGLYPRKGLISEGSDGDLVIFNPNVKSLIRADDQMQRVDYNLYEGFSQYGKFEYVFIRGKIAAIDEKPVLKASGKFIKREVCKM